VKYTKFLKKKKKEYISSGFIIDERELNNNLFDFQKYIVKISLQKGRFSIFADCGLGKTLMQLSWAEQVCKYTKGEVLILAPLAVVQQTKEESKKFNINLSKITITNYDQLENVNCESFSGVVLDESSILKSQNSKTKNKIISSFKSTKYKLCCTATPSPNDHMELGNHSEFLGAMSYTEMLAMFFVHDGGETSKWRLRKHAKDAFWKYVCTWSISVSDPKTLGFPMEGYELPEINYIEHIIKTKCEPGRLFQTKKVSATDIHKDLRSTIKARISKTAEIVDSIDGQCIVWGLQNLETDGLKKNIPDCKNVQGSDKPEKKANDLIGFAHKEYENLVTKTSIASFGMNYQQCSNMIFCSYDFKFEAFYQAVRRCYRFGQKNTVIHLKLNQCLLYTF